MAGITYFVALPFDVADGRVVVGEPIKGPTPPTAIGRAQGLWKVLGHTGAVAFSRTGDPATGDFHDATVLRKFGDVPDDLSALITRWERWPPTLVTSWCFKRCRRMSVIGRQPDSLGASRNRRDLTAADLTFAG